MDQTQKLYQSIVENARTGADACEQLLQRVEDIDMRTELMHERDEYQRYIREAEKALYAAGAKPHAKGPMQRMGMWMGIQMNTMTDVTPNHIAEMLIQGATMGVIGMTRDRNDLPDASPEARKLSSDFLVDQQNTIDRLKSRLSLHSVAAAHK